MTIGNPLKLSLDFPPSHTVHETFISHGVPSLADFDFDYALCICIFLRNDIF